MTRKEKARIFGESTAIRMFVTFLNEKNRGSNFKWSNFSEMCRRRAKIDLFTYIYDPDPTKEEEKLAGIAASNWATASLIESGVYEED